MTPLGLMSIGEKAEVLEMLTRQTFRDESSRRQSTSNSRLEELGLRVGKTVEMLNNGGRGPLLLKVDEARIAIDRGTGMKIMVRRQSA
jgi:ferrous iron transport protein A